MENTATTPNINASNLWKNILFHPTATFKYIFENQPKKSVFIFFVFGGMASGVGRLLDRNSLDGSDDLPQLLIVLLISGALGWISYYLVAYFLSIAGDILKGKASVEEFRTVIAWALVPTIFSLALVIPQYLIYGGGSNNSVWENGFSIDNTGLILLFLIAAILKIWMVFILVKGVVFIQKFSIGKALMNVVLPFVIVALFIFGLLAIIGALGGFN